MGVKKIVPCLDLKNARVVKGVNFVNLVDAGDPIQIAKAYEKEGADEIVLLDITASTLGQKNNTLNVIKEIVDMVNIPIIVGGGIDTVAKGKQMIDIGVSKISIGSAAVNNPNLINDLSNKLGKDKIVVGIDAKYNNKLNKYEVFIHGGETNTGKDAVKWAKELEEKGVGEILLTSMDADGTKDGYDNRLTKLVSNSVNIPVIASGGAGKKEDFLEVLTLGGAKSALAASLFHFKELEISKLKKYLLDNNVDVSIKE